MRESISSAAAPAWTQAHLGASVEPRLSKIAHFSCRNPFRQTPVLRGRPRSPTLSRLVPSIAQVEAVYADMNLMKLLPIASTLAFVSLSAAAQQPLSKTNPSQLGFFPDRLLARSLDRERALKPKEEFKECTRCPVMVVVPAGEFTMGSPLSDAVRAKPQHKVTIAQPYALSKFEVTFEEWDTCFALGGCSTYASDQPPQAALPGPWGRGQRPVISVSWGDAQEYVAWLSKVTGKSYRLPTEAEWEYAARAGSTTNYSWGDDIRKEGKVMANCAGCGGEWDNQKTAPVGKFAANAFGLYDMHGNVWELVQDCWHENYVGVPVDGSARTSGDDLGHCLGRVARGGSWSEVPRTPFGDPHRNPRWPPGQQHRSTYREDDYALIDCPGRLVAI